MSVLLTIAGILVCAQLFFRPIIGLADQGDFLKLLGPLGYAPVPKGPEHKYLFLTRTYTKDPSYREPRFEQLTSELIIATLAVKAYNAVLGNPNTFDLQLFGLVHASLFLLALTRLFYVTRRLSAYWIIWLLSVFILTDVGYVAYWNSLYTEPAACLWFLFFLCECVEFCQNQSASIAAIVRWAAFGALWVTAKTQNAPLCVPIAAFGVASLLRMIDWKSKLAVVGGIGVVCIAGVMMYRSILPAPRVVSEYDVIFYGMLPESTDPRSDLLALGLNPAYVRYAGTLPWSADTGVADGFLVNALLTKISPTDLLLFYVRRPTRMWRHLKAHIPAYFSLRPEFCGNFDASAGRPPGARSNAFALWSDFHEKGLARISVFLLATLLIAALAGAAMVVRGTLPHGWPALGLCLVFCCLISFFVGAYMDAYDNTKHQFSFNLLLDTCLVFAAASAFQYLEGHPRTPSVDT